MRLIAFVLLLCAAGSASAQYRVDWFKIAGGGGSSIGGQWRVSGTIGQVDPDVVPLCSQDGTQPGLCEGASVRLQGGFWVPLPRFGLDLSCGNDLVCVFRDGFESEL